MNGAESFRSPLKRRIPVKIRKMQVALELPFPITDEETGDQIQLSLSPQYFSTTVNRREYYFVRETDEIDGTATLELDGPIMIVGSADE